MPHGQNHDRIRFHGVIHFERQTAGKEHPENVAGRVFCIQDGHYYVDSRKPGKTVFNLDKDPPAEARGNAFLGFEEGYRFFSGVSSIPIS